MAVSKKTKKNKGLSANVLAEKITKCTEEVNAILAKYDCTLHAQAILESGKVSTYIQIVNKGGD